MSGKRILTLVLGVAAFVGLAAWWRESSQERGPSGKPSSVALETAAAETEASGAAAPTHHAAAETHVQPRADVREVRADGARAPFEYGGSDRGGAQVGGAAVAECEEKHPRENCVAAFTECQHKSRSLDVCKDWFESRDPEWAPDAEQGIRDFLADVGLLRLTVHDLVPNRDGIPLDCRTTYCRVVLDVDRAGLIEHLRSVGQYDGSYETGPRETRFQRLTTKWAEDRAQELRYALAFAGLLNDDSEVEVNGAIPPYREEEAVLIVTLHRCAKSSEHC
jgi:hypothetical protein